ncbi:MAG: IS1595 family transposase [Betaproteobacteria bacterium]|nr:IS1595 family transposase [Betaproteobacteria bacterium]
MANRTIKVQNQSTKNDAVITELPAACADERAAVEFMEKQRWGGFPACPHCGDIDVYQMKNLNTGQRQANYRWRCHGCKQQFSVRVGTVFEDSRIPLRHWCYAFWRASTSKKGVSALEIKRQTSLSYKSALFMLHRIQFAMQDVHTTMNKLSGDVEVDEVYIGGKPRFKLFGKSAPRKDKPAVVALVERGGCVHAQPVANVTGKTLKDVIRKNVEISARILTDELQAYSGLEKEFAGGHETVCHPRGEYARGDVTTNTVEGFFSIVRRGLDGIYHSVSKEYLPLYLNEFSFRYDFRNLDDGERTRLAIRRANGKRLTYKEQIE